MKVKQITYGAIIAALYAAVTLALGPFGSEVIQIRVSEALTVLAGITPVAIPGLFVGCLAANIFGGLGLIDIIMGSVTTLIAAIISWRLRKNPWLVPLPPIILNALVVGTYLSLFITPEFPVWLSILSVGAGQTISCYVFGMPLHYAVKRLNIFK